MDRKDAVMIIDAYSDFIRLNNIIKSFAGIINPNEYPGLYDLMEILMRYFKTYDYDKVMDVLSDNTIDSEEKYDRLLF